MGKVTILSGPRSGTEVDSDEKTGGGGYGRHLVEGRVETPMQTADRESGGDDSDANTASNAGRQAQSTDSMNKYQ
jgi:hypothetical protein